MAQAAGYRWIKWARERRLKGPRQAVLVAISTHANAAGEAFLTYDTLADETGFGRTTAMKAARDLVGDGYMTSESVGGRRANTYKLGGAQLALFAAESAQGPQRAAAPSDVDTEARFYNATNKKDAVAALVDAAREAGHELPGGRVAGLMNHHPGRSRGDVWRAWTIAITAKRLKGSPVNYAEEILKDGRVDTPEGRARGGARTATDASLEAARQGDF